jgi:predicted DNA-binding protein (MmcQ/YjbR family)
MRYTWLDEYLMQKPGVTKNTENWNWVRYMIGDKMFLAVCLDDHNKPYYITLKLDPFEGESLREAYEDIVPGFYMNKIHWNSIKPDGKVPDELLKEMGDKSYDLILKSFSKKKQIEILNML